jgi:hypothetical protein
MIKRLLFIGLLLATHTSYAQYNTPGTGRSWTLDSLVAVSSGTVTFSNGAYTLNAQLKVALNDTIQIAENGTLRMAAGVDIRVLGTLILQAPDSFVVQPAVAGQSFAGIEINASNATVLRKLHFYQGGSIRLLNSSILVDSCRFIGCNTTTASNALNLFQSSPLIRHSYFGFNAGSAIGGGGNINNAPTILSCRFEANVTANTNRPQINMGASGNDTLRIIGCTITGASTLSGGIGVFPVGSQALLRIEQNIIENNRYGIVCQSGPIRGFIRNNVISNNNIQNNPLQGGSGLNFNGGSTIQVLVQENFITGNLWGITIQGTAKPNIGDLRNSITNIGLNTFASNGNGGITYHIYNNTPDTIWAQNNSFGTVDSLAIEATLFHKPDQASLGMLMFDPWAGKILGTERTLPIEYHVDVYPLPAADYLHVEGLRSTPATVRLYAAEGKVVTPSFWQTGSTLRLDVQGLRAGQYLLEITQGGRVMHRKIAVHPSVAP